MRFKVCTGTFTRGLHAVQVGLLVLIVSVLVLVVVLLKVTFMLGARFLDWR